MCGRPAGWRVLADRARLGRPGSRLPLRASVAGLGGGISWRSPDYSLFKFKYRLTPLRGVLPVNKTGMNVRARMQLSHFLTVTSNASNTQCLVARFLTVAVPSVLSRHLLGDSTQGSNSPPQRPLLFSAVKTTSCDFLAVNLVSYTTKHQTASPSAQ